MARTGHRPRARSPKKIFVDGMKDYPEDRTPNPPLEAEAPGDEDLQEDEDEEELVGPLDDSGDGKDEREEETSEHNPRSGDDPGTEVRRLMRQVGRELANNETTTTTLSKVMDSYDDPQDLIDTVSGYIVLVLNKIERNKTHQDGFQDVDEEQTTSFAGHPAVIYLDSDIHELGKIGHLGGDWSLDCWHKNQNGKTICLSSRNKRKRQDSIVSIDDDGEDQADETGDVAVRERGLRKKKAAGRQNGSSKLLRTGAQQSSSKETTTGAEPRQQALLQGEKTQPIDQAIIVLPTTRDKDAFTPRMIAKLRDALLEKLVPRNIKIAVSDATEVIAPPVDPSYRGPRRWGFNRPIQGLKGRWQFVTWRGNDPELACDGSHAQTNVARSNGYERLHYATAEDVYRVRQELEPRHGMDNRTRGIRLVWVPERWDTEIHGPGENRAVISNAPTETTSAADQDMPNASNITRGANKVNIENDTDGKARTTIIQRTGNRASAGNASGPSSTTFALPTDAAATVGSPAPRAESMSTVVGGKSMGTGPGWDCQSKEIDRRTLGADKTPGFYPDTMIGGKDSGHTTRQSVAENKQADSQIRSEVAAAVAATAAKKALKQKPNPKSRSPAKPQKGNKNKTTNRQRRRWSPPIKGLIDAELHPDKGKDKKNDEAASPSTPKQPETPRLTLKLGRKAKQNNQGIPKQPDQPVTQQSAQDITSPSSASIKEFVPAKLQGNTSSAANTKDASWPSSTVLGDEPIASLQQRNRHAKNPFGRRQSEQRKKNKEERGRPSVVEETEKLLGKELEVKGKKNGTEGKGAKGKTAKQPIEIDSGDEDESEEEDFEEEGENCGDAEMECQYAEEDADYEQDGEEAEDDEEDEEDEEDGVSRPNALIPPSPLSSSFSSSPGQTPRSSGDETHVSHEPRVGRSWAGRDIPIFRPEDAPLPRSGRVTLEEFAENEEERVLLRGVLQREYGTPPPPSRQRAARRRVNEGTAEGQRRSERIAEARKKGQEDEDDKVD